MQIKTRNGRHIEVVPKKIYLDLVDKQNKEILKNISLQKRLNIAYKKIKDLEKEKKNERNN